MISKAQLKRLRALATKKHRKNSGEFLVQGEKNIVELLQSSLTTLELYVTEAFIQKNMTLMSPLLPDNSDSKNDKSQPKLTVTITTEDYLNQASTLSSNRDGIAIVSQPPNLLTTEIENLQRLSGLVLALDDVNDPGNLGTIIRLADWYGVSDILISEKTADVYNPKTISATMGAFTRVNIHRVDLSSHLNNLANIHNKPIFGAFLNGTSVHKCVFPDNAIIVMGNESHGISPEIESLITHKITIPSFGHSESLNVAMASGIILDNARRTLS